jgi:branched-chain amino acid transport system permease protein
MNMFLRFLRRYWMFVALAVLLVYPLLYRAPYYHVLGFNTLLVATAATGWNILGGYTGYKSLGHSTFFGINAYLVAIAANKLEWNPLWSAPILALVVALAALLLGWITARAKGSAFVIATIAMLLIFRLLALNLKSITGGAPGLSQPLAPWSPEFSRMPFYYYMLFWLVVALVVSRYIRHSRFGLGLLAIRDDEGKANMVGVNTTLSKVLAFGASAFFIALGGGIWSYAQTHIAPIFAFSILNDVDTVLATMLGGLGTLWGPVLGAFILIPSSDYILFKYGASQFHLAVFGVLMVVIILFLPRGILPSLQDRWAARKETSSAFSGARTMEAMSDDRAGERETGNSPPP